MQAAWIVDDSELDNSDSDSGSDDSMILDENNDGFIGQDANDNLDLDTDQASVQLNFRDSDEETENDLVMMVSI